MLQEHNWLPGKCKHLVQLGEYNDKDMPTNRGYADTMRLTVRMDSLTLYQGRR